MENPNQCLSLCGKKLDFGHSSKLVSLFVLSATVTHWCGQYTIPYLDPLKEAQFFHLQDTGLFEGLS